MVTVPNVLTDVTAKNLVCALTCLKKTIGAGWQGIVCLLFFLQFKCGSGGGCVLWQWWF